MISWFIKTCFFAKLVNLCRYDVANLLPAAVEAHESCSPLLLLTADRPPELRDTGANQSIDQLKIFGSFARYAVDLQPPGDGAPARVYATAAAAALRHLNGGAPQVESSQVDP